MNMMNMYNGENSMVLPSYAPESPETEKRRVAVCVTTDLLNIRRWAGYCKRDEDIDLGDGCYSFVTDVEAECFGPDDREGLLEDVRETVFATDPDADFEIV